MDTAYHPPSLPWKSLRHLTHLPEHSEKTKHLVQFHLFTNEETAQKWDIVVAVVRAEHSYHPSVQHNEKEYVGGFDPTLSAKDIGFQFKICELFFL